MLVTQSQAAARRQPQLAEAWITLGRAWVRKAREASDPGFYLNADAAANAALARAPGNGAALDVHLLVLLNDHKFEAARELAQKVVAAHPEDPMGYGSLSDALVELGRFDEASAAVQTMVNLKPNLASYSRASYIAWLKGDVDAAISIARLAIDAGTDARNPEPQAWQLVQTAMIFWHRGDYAGADAGFDVAIDRMGQYPPALVGKARVAMAKGDGKRAAELLDRAYAASPLTETAWLLGDARAMAGDAAGADRAYALVEKEGKLADRRTLSLYYSVKNVKPDIALALVETERKGRGDIYTDDAYAWALHRNGRNAEAKIVIDRALSHGTRDARLMFHSGAIRISTGDVAGGKKLIADALTLNPKFDVTGVSEAHALLGSGDAGGP